MIKQLEWQFLELWEKHLLNFAFIYVHILEFVFIFPRNNSISILNLIGIFKEL